MTAASAEVTAILDDQLGLTVTSIRDIGRDKARARLESYIASHPDTARWGKPLLQELGLRIEIATGGGNGADIQGENIVEVEPSKRELVQAPDFPDEAMPGAWRKLIEASASYTEAHPASIILPGLVMCGVEGGERVRLGTQRPIEYVAILGRSSVGRKDSGLEVALDLGERMRLRPPKLGQPNSGEGVWWAMRDRSENDPGADDFRLCLIDTEMTGTLAAAHRSGSTLMPALLSIYDRGNKSALTKRDRVTVTRGHFAYIGLGVPQIVARHLTLEDREAGLAPRLLIALVERVRTIPPSRALGLVRDEEALNAIADEICGRMKFAVSRGRTWRFSDAAGELLDTVADGLVDPDRPETARALAHVTRLAMLYHLTVPPPGPADADEPGVIAPSHLNAAIAAYRYCDESAKRLYGNDDLLDRLVMFVKDKPDGLSRTEVYKLLGNNVAADELNEAISRGHTQGRLRLIKIEGRPGRPTERIQPR